MIVTVGDISRHKFATLCRSILLNNKGWRAMHSRIDFSEPRSFSQSPDIAAQPKIIFQLKILIAAVWDRTVTGQERLQKLNSSQLFRCVPVLFSSDQGTATSEILFRNCFHTQPSPRCPQACLGDASPTVTTTWRPGFNAALRAAIIKQLCLVHEKFCILYTL